MKMKIRKGHKKCSTCGKIMMANLKNFHSDSHNLDGLNNNCKVCQRIYTTKTYYNNSEYYSKYNILKKKLNDNKISVNVFIDTVSKLKNYYGIGSNSRSYV
jgi:hypothetical protein